MQHYVFLESLGNGLLESAIRSGFRVISGARLRLHCDGGVEKGLQACVTLSDVVRSRVVPCITIYVRKVLLQGSLNQQSDRDSELFRARDDGYSALVGVKRACGHD